jgi:hypothetical protein
MNLSPRQRILGWAKSYVRTEPLTLVKASLVWHGACVCQNLYVLFCDFALR